jgi:hypothetical protein
MKNVFVKTHIFRGQKRTKECLQNLSSSEISADIYINSFCYLCYRVIDSSLQEDLSKSTGLFLFKNFKKAQSRLEEISCPAVKARWYSSLVMAYCYMYTQLIGFDENIFEITLDFVKKDTTKFWKNSIVNSMMCRLACVAHMIKKENYKEANALISESDDVYKKAVTDFDTKSFFDTLFEISDATKLYFCIILFGKISGYPLIYSVDKIFARLVYQQLHNPYNSLNSYYKLICSIIPELNFNPKDSENLEFTNKYIISTDLKSFLPEDFCLKTYRELNPDVANQPDSWLMQHFKAKPERPYKIDTKDLPVDFSADTYRKLNPDISKFSDKQLINHYVSTGKKENRFYKIKTELLPLDFDVTAYKKYNLDIEKYSDEAATLHYLNFGKKENRVYKVSLPEFFDVEQYRFFNKDIAGLSKDQLEAHYEAFGKTEGRKYFDRLFDLAFFIKYNNLPQNASYLDYAEDIRKIKSKKILDDIEKIDCAYKGAILLVNHLSSFNGATQYLAGLYSELKMSSTDKKIYFVDSAQNVRLRDKYCIAAEDYISYEEDSTILYYICSKIEPYRIYFNSINSNYSDVIKWLDSKLILWHSHEVKKHFEYLSDVFAPTHVVSSRIQKEYTVNLPKIQKEVLTKKELDLIDSLKFEKICDIKNNVNTLNLEKITIGMCGSLCDRKNYRLFVELAKIYTDYNFLWIGGDRDIHDDNLLNFYQIRYTANPYSYFSKLDYFFLTSQVDPCPYVVLENLYLGNCVITFKENIYTDHKCELLTGVYFEYPGELNISTACAALNKFVHPSVKPLKSSNGARYVVDNFSRFDRELLELLK